MLIFLCVVLFPIFIIKKRLSRKYSKTFGDKIPSINSSQAKCMILGDMNT